MAIEGCVCACVEVFARSLYCVFRDLFFSFVCFPAVVIRRSFFFFKLSVIRKLKGNEYVAVKTITCFGTKAQHNLSASTNILQYATGVNAGKAQSI
jgi:hypothetical protein